MERDVKFTKLTETEAYLTTFERTMQAAKGTVGLQVQLTGKAQQTFAAMETDSAGSYDDVKAVILQRYNINEESRDQPDRLHRPCVL